MIFVRNTVTISIRSVTHRQLQSIGTMDQTFDDVISELLKRGIKNE